MVSTISAVLPSLPPSLQTLAAPTSQKGKTIGFSLDNLATKAKPETVNLLIRPEDLTRQSNSRLTVQQSLGGTGWADDFGSGLDIITIQGTTGWRGVAGNDGAAQFKSLYAMVYTGWHAARNQARQKGTDPNQIELIFTDSLDEIVEVVAPISFQLHRSKSRPLLSMYNASFIVLGDTTPAPPASLLSSIIAQLGLTSIANAVGNIMSAEQSAIGFVQAGYADLQGYMTMACGVFNQAIALIQLPAAAINTVTGIASALAQTGMQVLNTLGAAAQGDVGIQAAIMGVASAFTDVFCALSRIVPAQSFPVYTALLGASGCSSTVAGGAPLSQYQLADQSSQAANPFYDVIGSSPPPPIALSPTAQLAIQTILFTDPVLNPIAADALMQLLNQINAGVSITASTV